MLKGSITISIPFMASNIFYDTFLWFMNWFGFRIVSFFLPGAMAFRSWEGLASKRLPDHQNIFGNCSWEVGRSNVTFGNSLLRLIRWLTILFCICISVWDFRGSYQLIIPLRSKAKCKISLAHCNKKEKLFNQQLDMVCSGNLQCLRCENNWNHNNKIKFEICER